MTDTRYALAHGEPIVVVAPEGVDAAISEVMARHRAELDEALAPFGVALDDLMQATWMRIVRFGDVVPLGDPPIGRAEGEALVDGVAEAERAEGEALAEAIANFAPLVDGVAEAYAIDELPPLVAGGCCGSGEACSAEGCTGTPRDEDNQACDRGTCVICSPSAPAVDGVYTTSAPAVDGVYMTDLPREPEPFGERIDVHPEPRQDADVLGAPGVPMSGPRFGRGGVRGDDE